MLKESADKRLRDTQRSNKDKMTDCECDLK